jgi:hypothetical protein
MAQRVQTLLIDDLDGGEAEGTVRFGLDGAEYEIDLSADHAGALRRALAPYVSAARRAPGCGRWRCGPGGGPGVGQVPGHRGQGPRAGAGRAGREVQGGHGAVAHGFGPGDGTAALKRAPRSRQPH